MYNSNSNCDKLEDIFFREIYSTIHKCISTLCLLIPIIALLAYPNADYPDVYPH